MFKYHPFFYDEIEDNKPIWRYIDFYKFFSLLEKKALFFCKVKHFIDNWEGAHPLNEIQFLKRTLEQQSRRENQTLEEFEKSKVESFNNWQWGFDYQTNINYINSWSISAHENMALWKLYVKGEKGIAIKSNELSFKNSFKGEEKDIHMSKIIYINYSRDYFYQGEIPKKEKSFQFQNLYAPYVHKRNHFAYENEYRALISLHNDDDGKHLERIESGVFVPVDLNILIEEIYISPNSTKDFLISVQNLLELFKISKRVRFSELDDQPYKLS